MSTTEHTFPEAHVGWGEDGSYYVSIPDPQSDGSIIATVTPSQVAWLAERAGWRPAPSDATSSELDEYVTTMSTTTQPTDQDIALLATQLVDLDEAARHLAEAAWRLVEVGELADDADGTVQVAQARIRTAFDEASRAATGFEFGELVQAAAWYWDADAEAPAPFIDAAGAADVAHRLVGELMAIYRNGAVDSETQAAAARVATLLGS